MGIGFIGVIVVIAPGVGLLQANEYRRKLAVYYAIHAIITSIVDTIINTFFIFLSLMKKLNAIPDAPQKAGAMGSRIGGIMGDCVGLIYPALVLYFMTCRRVIDALKPCAKIYLLTSPILARS